MNSSIYHRPAICGNDEAGDDSAPSIAGPWRVEILAGCACAAGPVHSIAVGKNGRILLFREAYPNAPKWMQRLAYMLMT